eukprot:CAMPEP_0119309800 /NCGR_PEP_ID=MMETSP1333-20130426/16842_1 /TAXON_ID=418940 /ORGANISM="Scyphosphaera apsteinii, Strain RCC1455" /LENGTH=37 /DNA_ID= /DNA_START= /DNA_END= /DNA_ORIENTATION=
MITALDEPGLLLQQPALSNIVHGFGAAAYGLGLARPS